MDKSNFKIDTAALKSVLAANPEADSVIATSDGNFFLPAAKSYAQNHCKVFNLKSREVKRHELDVVNNGVSEEPAADTTKAAAANTKPASDETPAADAWRDLPYKKLLEHATEVLGLTDLATKPNQGAGKLLEEIDAKLAQ